MGNLNEEIGRIKQMMGVNEQSNNPLGFLTDPTHMDYNKFNYNPKDKQPKKVSGDDTILDDIPQEFIDFLEMTGKGGMAGKGGIEFKDITIADAKLQAKSSGKYIFIDAHTSWCGPCKKMASTSFKNPKVGSLYNEKFINLKIDVEKDADGHELMRTYKVRTYPTLLVINYEGKLIKSILGLQSEKNLIDFANSVV